MRTLKIAVWATVLSSFGIGQPNAPLRLENTIVLENVQGRIDHMSEDAQGGRLFVAALGNNTVEVIDVRNMKRLHTITGLHEPQGVLYVPAVHRVYVANGADGTVRIFDGISYAPLKTVHLGDDADNIRYDPERRLIYVGYGGGALAILKEDGVKAADIRVDAHPESFQLERGARIFVNLPDSRKIGVLDRTKQSAIASWGTDGARSNYPMALDEQQERLFVVCRRPAELLVLDTRNGKIVAKVPSVGDCDDVFYDRTLKRIYASGGEGAVSVFAQQDADHYTEVARVRTSQGGRTSFFSPVLQRLYVAARREGAERAAIRVYATQR